MGRVLPRRPFAAWTTFQLVSIPTRPAGRVLRAAFDADWSRSVFQSSPDLWAGCYSYEGDLLATDHRRFQSSPDLWAGCYILAVKCGSRDSRGFNPHPTYGPGATLLSGVRRARLLVSILTRPMGRVLRSTVLPIMSVPSRFQSSPDLWAGCYGRCWFYTAPGRMFQSSPDLWAGCYGGGRPDFVGGSVFQSSPDLWAGCYTVPGRGLPNHPNRFNPHPTYGPGATREVRTGVRVILFQSSPDLWAGCYLLSVSIYTALRHCFNPHPTYGPGATLTRFAAHIVPPSFNPHPTYGPGATGECLLPFDVNRRFNPHPTYGPGATDAATHGQWRVQCFNPHPTYGPGATRKLVAQGRSKTMFQSSPDLWAGCYPILARHSLRNQRVSILTRPMGRVLHWLDDVKKAAKDLFQSSPDLWAGCYCSTRRSTSGSPTFQSSPDLWAGCYVEAVFQRLAQSSGVSILTRPMGRVLPLSPTCIVTVDVVSILTRPMGRVLREY